MFNVDQVGLIVDALLVDKTPDEQVAILRDCFINHAVEHPWLDTELADCILANVCREYNISYQTCDEDSELEVAEDDESRGIPPGIVA